MNDKQNLCKRIINSDEYERNDPNNELWWQNTFKKLEDEFQVPIEERLEILKQTVPRQIVNRIREIYKCDDDTRREPVIDYGSVESCENNLDHPSDDTICKTTYVSLKKYELPSTLVPSDSKYISQDTIGGVVIKQREFSRSSFRTPSGSGSSLYLQQKPKVALKKIERKIEEEEEKVEEEEEQERCKNIGSNNPYMNFFKRPRDRAATWRPLPQLSLEQLGLLEKADAIKAAISNNFVEWLNTIGGNDKNTITASAINKMFQVGFRTHAATSLCVRIKEMPSVPDEVAKARFVKANSNRETLYRQLEKDIKVITETKAKMYAFGKLLPRELRISAPAEDITVKWLHGVKVPKDLEDMSAVWSGITNLRSTRGFCNWLLNHPEIPEPPYLKRMGLLDESQRNKRFSLDSRKMMIEIHQTT